MRAMIRERRCRMREARTPGEAEVGGAECGWEFREWEEVRTAVDAEAEAGTRAMKTGSECRKW
jgi:hypothetical protein